MAYDIVDFGWLGDLPKQFPRRAPACHERAHARRSRPRRRSRLWPRGNGAARRRRHRWRRVAGAAGGGALSIARPIRPGGARRPSAPSAMPIGPTACISASSTRRSRAGECRPASVVVRMWDSHVHSRRPRRPVLRRSVGDRRSPNATAGHAIDAPAGGANVAGFAEPTTLITGLIGDRVMARALSTHATAAPLARWSRAYSALARQPSARRHGRLRDGVTQSRQHHVRSPRQRASRRPISCARCRVRCRHPQRRNSSHPTCRKCDCELRVQKGHWNDNIARAVLINSRLFVDLADVRFTPYRDR